MQVTGNYFPKWHTKSMFGNCNEVMGMNGEYGKGNWPWTEATSKSQCQEDSYSMYWHVPTRVPPGGEEHKLIAPQ
jgi:hypothetical protein